MFLSHKMEEKGWDYKTLSDHLGVSWTTVWRWCFKNSQPSPLFVPHLVKMGLYEVNPNLEVRDSKMKSNLKKLYLNPLVADLAKQRDQALSDLECAKARLKDYEELVGIYEIAEIAHVGKPAVINWRMRVPDFPRPIAELRAGPVFRKSDILRWLEARNEPKKAQRAPGIRRLSGEA